MTATGPAPRSRGRAPKLVLLAVLLFAGAVADRVVDPPPPSPRTVAARGTAPPAAAPGAVLSDSWYCSAGSATGSGVAEGSVVIANAGGRARRAAVTVFASEGQPVTTQLEVPARGRASLRYSDVVKAPFAAASVELDGGDVAVEQVVDGPQGHDAAPCAPGVSDRWHLASGVTAKDATMLVALFNPFAGDAIVDMRFVTEEGGTAPGDFEGVSVPARSVVVKDIGEHVRRREQVSATIRTRNGARLAVSRIQQLAGSGRSGLGLTLGAAPAATWHFPEGLVADGITERFELYNPSKDEAVVVLSLVVDEAEVEPFELIVPAEGRLRFTANEQERIPRDKPHAVSIRSLNGVDIVAEQTVDAAPPAGRAGYLATSGGRVSARQWLLAAGGTSAELDEWVVVLNTGTKDGHVAVVGMAGQALAVEGLQRVPVPAGRRVAIRISDHVKRDDLPLVVRSDVDIVAFRSLYRLGRPGISSVAGVPLTPLTL